jgi:UDP:flavonoid glycosyltransferase YjiC (YdhE family)
LHEILIASTAASGLFNPLLTIGRISIAAGHEVAGLTGSTFHKRVEGIGAKFHPCLLRSILIQETLKIVSFAGGLHRGPMVSM